jgi:hypothetical protein
MLYRSVNEGGSNAKLPENFTENARSGISGGGLRLISCREIGIIENKQKYPSAPRIRRRRRGVLAFGGSPLEKSDRGNFLCLFTNTNAPPADTGLKSC